MTPFAQAAPDLIDLGFSPIPIIAPDAAHGGRGKAPGDYRGGRWQGLSRWQRFRDGPPSSFEMNLWLKAPGANVGIVMGTPAGRDAEGEQLFVIGIDFDAVDPDALDTLLGAAPASPMVKRGQKGETRLFRARKTIKTKVYDDTSEIGPDGKPLAKRLIDLLAGFDTRQTVVPPSVHPDTGQAYVWTAGPVPTEQLPILTEDDMAVIEEALETCGWERGGRSTVRSDRTVRQASEIDPDDMWSEVKAAAMGSLAAWVPHLDLYGLRPARGGYEAVATWRASSSGRPIPERKLNLSIQTHGIKDFGTNDTYSSIDLVMAARDCDQAEATDWLRERLGLKDEAVVIDLAAMLANSKTSMGIPIDPDHDLPEPLRRNASDATDTAVYSPQPVTSEPLSNTSEERVQISGKSEHGPELPEHLTRNPGLLGLITDWICDSARKPQRGGALLAAIELIGTAAGRKYAGPTLTGTHLYGLFLAPSGAAKDHPLKCIGRILHASTMAPHFGPSGFMSMSALINRMSRQPLTLTCIDEFGSFLGRINGKRASTHEKAITGVLRTAWGSSFDTMAPPEWAGRVGEPIHSPALSLFCVSTHQEFFDNLEGGDVYNGFLNRFLLISTQRKVVEREPTADKMVVPAPIVDGMLAIYTSGNPLARASSHSSISDAPMIVVPWLDGPGSAAHRIYQGLAQDVERREAEAAFLARTVEMAQRLAVIRAIGINPAAPSVSPEDIEWGRQIALWSAERMMADAADYMHETEFAKQSAAVLSAINRAGRLQRNELVRKFYGRLDGRLLDGIVKSLVDGEMVREEKVPAGPSGGRPKLVYVAA